MAAGTGREPEESAPDPRWHRRYGLQVVLAGGLFGAAVLVASIYHLPVRDPDDSIVGPVYVRLPLIAVCCFLVDVLVRSVRRGSLLRLRSTVPEVVRERWPAPRVRLVLIGLGSWYLAYVGFRNLKSYVPFVRPHMADGILLHVDRVLALGHNPATVLHDLFGTGVAAHLMSFTYVAWILFLSLSLLVALFWTRDLDTACWYVTAVAVNWVLGVAVYYLVPSVGPIYARPALFADLAHTQTTEIAQTWMADRVHMLADPFGTPALQTVAAFASLHVSVMVTAALVARLGRLRPVSVQWSLWAFLLLNVLATVYLGWHYVVDVFGGVAVGVAAVWIAAYGTGNTHRLPSPVPRRSRPVGVTGARAVEPVEAEPSTVGYVRPERERFWTWPTVVTVARTVGALAMVVAAVHEHSIVWLLAGLATYWLGDVVDGWLARRLDRETRIGAVADILCDRLSAGSFYVGLLWLDPTLTVPVATYLVEFMVVDLVLSLTFLAWPLVSPNYFYLVDRRTWLLNWSPVGKSVNSAVFAGILLLTRDAALATGFAIALLVLKGLSLARVLRLRVPNARTRPSVWVRTTTVPTGTGVGPQP